MDDREFLAQRVKDLEASVAFFAAGNKRESERWVASAFVENLRIQHDPGEIISPEDDPPDVVFREARFEIKEILDPDRRRHDEYKQELERARGLTDPKDLLQEFNPKDSSLVEIYDLCSEVVASLSTKYPPAVRGALDLLFYVNLLHVIDVAEEVFPNASAIASGGWRSVSFVMGQRSCAFHARADAPLFIQQAVGYVSHLHPP